MLSREEEEKKKFRIECRNRFLVLETLEEGRSVDEMLGDVNKALYNQKETQMRKKDVDV